MKIEKEIYNYIEFELNHFDYYKKMLEQQKKKIKSCIENKNPYNLLLSSEKSDYSDVILLPSYFAMEQTVSSVMLTLSELSEVHKKLFEEIYQKKRKDIFLLCNELCISHETFKRYKKSIIYGVGINLGVIKSFD